MVRFRYQEAEAVLHPLEGGQSETIRRIDSSAQLARVHVATSDVLNEAALDHRSKTLESLFNGRVWVRRMRKVKRNSFDPKPLETGTELLLDVGLIERATLNAVHSGRSHLRCDVHVCASLFITVAQPLPDRELGISTGISLGRVQDIDS